MKIIAISGKAQHGKDTTAEFLKSELETHGYKVQIAHYADLLKYICNFIFKSRLGKILNSLAVNEVIGRIIRDCNMEETARAKQERREPVLLPHFSAHNLRHTFCTRLCENEPNLKVIQEIMGHQDIKTTMDVYNEATKEKKMFSFANLEGKIRLS